MEQRTTEMTTVKLCECGCGGIVKTNGHGFCQGHSSKGSGNPMFGKHHLISSKSKMGPKGHNFNGKICSVCGKIHNDITGNNNVSKRPEVVDKIRTNMPIEYLSLIRLEWIKNNPGWQKGKNNSNFGKKAKPETIEKMRIASTGVVKSKETIAKFSATYKRNGKTKGDLNPSRRPENALKISLALKGLMPGEFNPNWKGGVSRLPYPFNFDEMLKEKIRARDNYSCQLCGISENKRRVKLPVHHVDYDKNNLLDNNLVTLCIKHNGTCNGNRSFWTEYWNDYLHENYYK